MADTVTVAVDGVGQIEFPGTMSEQEIRVALSSLFPPAKPDPVEGFTERTLGGNTPFDPSWPRDTSPPPGPIPEKNMPGGLGTQLKYGALKAYPEASRMFNRGIEGAARLAQDPVLNPIGSRLFGRGFQNLEQSAKVLADEASKYSEAFEEAGQRTEGPEFPRQAAGAAGSLIGTVGAGLTGGFPAMIGAAGFQSFGATYEESYKARMEGGMSEEEAKTRATGDGLISGLITSLVTAGFGKTGIEAITAARSSPGFVQGVLNWLKQAGMEATEEAVDEGLQKVQAKMSYNPDLSLEQAVTEVAAAGAIGGILGGTVTAPKLAIDVLGKPKTSPDTKITPKSDHAFPKALSALDEWKYDQIRLEGATGQEALDLISGKVSVKDFVAEKMGDYYAPAWDANVSQVQGGHAEAWEAGFNDAVMRLDEILSSKQIGKSSEQKIREAEERLRKFRETQTPASPTVAPSAAPTPSTTGTPYRPPIWRKVLGTKIFGVKGLLPTAFRLIKDKTPGLAASIMEEAKLVVNDAKAQMESDYTSAADRNAAQQRIYDYMTGNTTLDTVGDVDLQKKVKAMRDTVDKYSQELVDSDAVTGTKADTIESNIGRWLRRDFLAFDPDARWTYDSLEKRRVNDPEIDRIWNNAEAFLKAQMPSATNEEIAADMRALVDRNMLDQHIAWAGSRGGALSETGPLGKDITSLLRRKNIPQPILDWMGEVKNPFEKTLRSANWLGQYIARYRGLEAIRDIGLRLGFFSQKKGGPKGEYSTQIYPNETLFVPMTDDQGQMIKLDDGGFAGDWRSSKNFKYHPLGGLWTTKELAEYMDLYESGSQGNLGKLAEMVPYIGHLYQKYVTYAKMNLVAWNPKTWVTNILGGLTMTAANGNINPKRHAQAFRAITSSKGKAGDLMASDLAARADRLLAMEQGVMSGGFFTSDVEYSAGRDIGQRGVRDSLRAVASNARALLQDKDPAAFGPIVKALGDLMQKPGKWMIENPDNYFRLVTFFSELDLAKRAHPNMTPAEQAAWAADRASNTYQTYDRLFPGLRDLSRLGALNTFVSFKLELARNMFWTARYIYQDATSGNPVLRRDAGRRAAAFTTTLAAPIAISALTAQQVGMDDQDEKDLKWFLPPWDQAETMFYVGKDGTKIRYAPMSYVIPHQEVWRIVKAAQDSTENPEQSLDRLWQGMVADYFGPGAAAGPLMESAFNFRIGTAGSPLTQKEGVSGIGDRINHMWSQVMAPKFLVLADDFRKAYANEKGNWGKVYDERDLGLSLISIRTRQVDIKDQLPYQMSKYNRRWRKAKGVETYGERKYEFAPEKVQQEAEYTARKTAEIKTEYQSMIDAAKRLGVSPLEIGRMEKEMRIPNDLRK